MKVLLVSTNADLAGAPIHVQTILENLKDRVVFKVVFGEEGPVAERVRSLGVEVQVLGSLRSQINLFKDILATWQLYKLAREFKADLIHAHSSKAGLLARLVSWKLNCPSIYTVHGWGWRGLPKTKSSVVFILEKIASYLPNSFYVFVANSVADDGLNLLKISSNKTTVIYNGVHDLSTSSIKTKRNLTIIMPARVAAAKDHETLIRAFEQSTIDAKLVLCGRGTDEYDFYNKLRAWSPTKFSLINCLGERPDSRQLISKSDIFVLISNFEALPISIIEAMAAKKAIIATNVGGVSELIKDGSNGKLVEKSDIRQLIEALNSMSDDKLRSFYAEQARLTYITNFTSEVMANKLYDFYREVVLCKG